MDKVVYRPFFHPVDGRFFPLGYRYVEELDEHRKMGCEYESEDECQARCNELNKVIGPIVKKVRGLSA